MKEPTKATLAYQKALDLDPSNSVSTKKKYLFLVSQRLTHLIFGEILSLLSKQFLG